MPGADLRADAEVIGVTAGGTWTSQPTNNTALSIDTDDDYLYGYRSAWWSFTPDVDGTLHVDTELSDYEPPMILNVVTEAAEPPLTVVASDYSDGPARLATAVTAGVTYWVRAAIQNNWAGYEYVLRAQMVPAALPMLGHVDVDVQVAGQLLPFPGALIGAIDVDVQVAGQLLAGRAVPAAETLTEAPAPALMAATVTPLAPAHGLVLPSLRPVFDVAVRTDDTGVRVQVQYDVSAAFNNPAELLSDDTVQSGPDADLISLRAQPGDELADDVAYVWRARAVSALGATEWTAPRTFAVNRIDGDAVAAGGCTVTAAVLAAPDLWFVAAHAGNAADDPSPDAAPGSTAVAYGTALTNPQVTVAGTPAQVLTFTTVPAADAGDERVIDPAAGRVDAWHQRLEFVVPPIDEQLPGGAVHVQGG